MTIDLLDTNDNAPQFESPTHITVTENTPSGTSVYKIIATDVDQNNNGRVLYSITSDPGNAFSIGRMDGVLRVSHELDRESVDEYTLSVRAADQGSPAKFTDIVLTVTVGDKNDHEPVFDPTSYSAELEENVPVGTSVLTLIATDLDSGLNAEIRYIITEGDDNHDFYINTKTGELSVQKRLDYERHKEYTIIIMAQDLGDPAHMDTAKVTIIVTDINDCPPKFVDSPFVVYVQEENVVDLPVHVVVVNARDDDSGSNGQVGYSITEGDRANFRINATTGEIMALRTLDREERAEYDLVVQAMDKGEFVTDIL